MHCGTYSWTVLAVIILKHWVSMLLMFSGVYIVLFVTDWQRHVLRVSADPFEATEHGCFVRCRIAPVFAQSDTGDPYDVLQGRLWFSSDTKCHGTQQRLCPDMSVLLRASIRGTRSWEPAWWQKHKPLCLMCHAWVISTAWLHFQYLHLLCPTGSAWHYKYCINVLLYVDYY